MKTYKQLISEVHIGLGYSFRNFNTNKDRQEYLAQHAEHKDHPNYPDFKHHIEKSIEHSDKNDELRKFGGTLARAHWLASRAHENAADSLSKKLQSGHSNKADFKSHVANKIDDHVKSIEKHRDNKNYLAAEAHLKAIEAGGDKSEPGKHNYVTGKTLKSKFDSTSDSTNRKYPA